MLIIFCKITNKNQESRKKNHVFLPKQTAGQEAIESIRLKNGVGYNKVAFRNVHTHQVSSVFA